MSSSAQGIFAGLGRAARLAALATIVATLAAITGWILGSAISQVVGDPNAKWILGRSAGITAYGLLTLLVATGLVLSHPWRSRMRRPALTTRIRLHIGLAAFTFVFTVLHIVILATDEYAGVGWSGALLPLGSEYRPLPVTLGVIGFYSGLIAGLTALISSRITFRLWLPIHRVAIGALLLVWTHGVLAGSDTPVLMMVYVLSGAAVIALAVSRYTARSPRDEAAELIGQDQTKTVSPVYVGGRTR